MHSGIIFIGCMSLVSWVIQFLPVISVPITGPLINYELHFSTFNNYTYGVFGVCDIARNICSEPSIGYPKSDLFYYDSIGVSVDDEQLSDIQLPSDATKSISKLLVVHIVAFCFTSALVLESMILLLALYLHEKHPGTLLWGVLRRKPEVHPTQKPRKKDITSYLEWMLLFSMLSFMLTLLAFLADILLFIPRLSFLGWIQLLPILLMALIASLVCLMKRSISSRRHLEEEETYPANEMRSKNGILPRWADESASDDGFYVYTNGFYTANNEPDRRSTEVHILRPGRHYSDETRQSEDLGDGIELRNMRRES